MRVAVLGAGWAGCAAAVEAARRGHEVILLEAARQAGGRARRLVLHDKGQAWPLDNGQHILIGAYRESLQLMRELGVNPDTALRRLPLTLQTPEGLGLALPGGWPAQLAVLAGVLGARGWSWADKLSLLKCALGWQAASFECAPGLSVAQLCQTLTPRVRQSLIEPLCVSALNTPIEQASAHVFLRVLKDALFAERGGADLLLPSADLSSLLPDAAMAWLQGRGHAVHLGTRVKALHRVQGLWQLETGTRALTADAVLMACPAWEAARMLAQVPGCDAWVHSAQALSHAPIATVYVRAPGAHLQRPMLALPSDAQAPAQFVFDRSQLGGPPGLLAFVVSASQGSREEIETAVLAQAQAQLGLAGIEALSTVIEKRATFACTPGLQRPGMEPLRHDASLRACGDYIDGPYPATLEGAVRSGLAAARAFPHAANALPRLP